MKYDKCRKAFGIPSVGGRAVFDFLGLGKHRRTVLAVAAVPVVTRWAVEAEPRGSCGVFMNRIFFGLGQSLLLPQRSPNRPLKGQRRLPTPCIWNS